MSSKASKKNTPTSVKKTEKQDTPKKVEDPVEEEVTEEVADPDVADVDPDVEIVEDEEPAEDAEEPAEDADEEEDSKPAKKGSKSAPKKGGKPTAKKGGKSTAKKASKELSDEQKRYDAAMKAAVDASYVNDHDSLKPRSVHDKCGGLLSIYILEAINKLQQEEVVDGSSYNPYPSSKYLLLEDKLSGNSAVKGKTVKKTGESSGKPSKKRLPPKRGQKKEEEPEAEVADVEEDVEEPAEEPAEDGKEDKEDTEDSNDAVEEGKEEKKKNIVTISKNGKTYLGFIMMRFVDELYSTEGGKNIRNNDDFTKFVMEKITKDINSHMARVVVCTVNRCERRVAGMADHTFQKDIGNRFEEYFGDRTCIAKYIGDYLMQYFKLLAQSIASDLWVSHKGVNGQTIEKAMRQLNMGNYEYMVDTKYVVDGESDYGLNRGVLDEARAFDKLLNPPPPPLTEEEKKERAAKREKTAEEKKAGKAPAKKGKAAAKKPDAKKGKAAVKKPAAKKGKASKEEEPEEEVEAEEAEPEAEVEPEAEDEPEPEPEPVKKGGKKNLKKL